MIAFLKGEIVDLYSDRIIISCNDIGYEVFVTTNFLSNISTSNKNVKVFTYMNVKEDSITLFGFAAKEELNIFKQLITVSGIGPKGALAILSTFKVQELKMAILSEDAKTISKAPGIGAKTASRLIIELKDKLSLNEVVQSNINQQTQSPNIDESVKKDATDALVALGYSPSQAFMAVSKVSITDTTSSEILIKEALKKLI